MHVLVATRELQGAVPGDFCWTIDDELVSLPSSECFDAERCGCGRSFAGLASHRATTTARVENRADLTEADYMRLLVDADLDDIASFDVDAVEFEEARQLAERDAKEFALVAATLPAGAIVERRDGKVRVRA